VHVDETRCDGATGDVDLLMRIGATECTQRGDTTFGDREVAGNRRRAGAVIEQRIAQDKVEVFHVPSPAIARPAGLPVEAEKNLSCPADPAIGTDPGRASQSWRGKSSPTAQRLDRHTYLLTTECMSCLLQAQSSRGVSLAGQAE